jgi:hypothetical protein
MPPLEVFESIKVFLDIKGFVFVIEPSRQVLDKLVRTKGVFWKSA